VKSPIPGTLTFRGLATVNKKLATQSTADVVDRTNQTGGSGASQGVPRYSINGSFNYDYLRFHALFQVRYVPSGFYDNTMIGPDDPRYAAIVAQGPTNPLYTSTVNNNRVASMTTVNIGLRYAIIDSADRNLEAYLNVDNLFNADPPIAPNTSYQTNTSLFDAIGQRFTVGVRFKY